MNGRQQYRGDADDTLYLTGKEPLVKDIVARTFPGYTRVTYRLHVTDGPITVRPKPNNRSDFMFYDLTTQEIRRVVKIEDDNKEARRRTRLPAGVICIEHRYVKNRSYGMIIHVTNDDAGPFLPPVQSGITQDQQIVLRYTSRLMASYGGNIRWRQTCAYEDTGITDDRWNAAREQLVKRGLLNTRYGLTDQGANQIRLPAEAKAYTSG